MTPEQFKELMDELKASFTMLVIIAIASFGTLLVIAGILGRR